MVSGIDTIKVSMETRELQAFLTVAEELNFRKAAERLGMTQPPLTRLIHQFESRLGVNLFNRSTRSVELTGEGIHLLKHARSILKTIESVEKELRSLSKIKKEKLTICFSQAAIHSSIPRLISSFRKQFPNIQIKIIQKANSTIKQELRKQTIDIAFDLNKINDSQMSHYEVESHELGVLVAHDNPLASKKSIKFEHLENQTIIFHPKSDRLGFQEEFYAFLKRNEINVKAYYKKSGESCAHLSVLGKGVLITSKSMAGHIQGAVFIPFADYYSRLKITGTWSTENLSTPLAAFISFLQEQSKAPQSERHSHLA